MNIKNKIKFILLALIFLPVVIINFHNNIHQIINMFSSIFNSISSGRGAGFVRLNLILNGLYFLYNSFGFGVGAGNIEFYMRNNAIFETFGIENMHNWWFEIITNYGIIIFMLYLMFFIRIFFKIYMIRKTENNKIFSEAILLSLIGFIFASISPSTFIAFRPQWIIIGIAIAYINSHKKDLIRT
jgi:teichuronic acid biosynthesis protein TuaE